MRIILLTAATLLCFAANSLLTRSALGDGTLDAASFMLVRLSTGALTLVALAQLSGQRAAGGGTWRAAFALAGYTVAFTFAYTRIGAATGALLLFGAVQTTMIATGLLRGERPRRLDWLGVALAIAGLLVLTLPGATAPDAIGAILMIAAGVCWGAYSLLGRGGGAPLPMTAGNFLRATLIAALAVGALLPRGHWTREGLTLATASGALASGVGYTMWYAVLPALAAWRAAVIQLLVPILTALLAWVILGESIGARLLLAGAIILAGIGLTVVPARTPALK